MQIYSLGKCSPLFVGGGGMRLRKKGVGPSGGGGSLKMQEGIQKIDKEEKIRGYSRKGNLSGRGKGGGGI